MPKWGGPRPNSGRPVNPIRTSKIAASILKQAQITGKQTPLDFLYRIAMDESQEIGLRIDCAKACCPYMFPKLQSVQVQQDDSNKLVVVLQSFSSNKDETRTVIAGQMNGNLALQAVTEAVIEQDDDE